MDIPSESSHCAEHRVEQSHCVAKGFNALTSFSKNFWRTDKTMRKSIDWKLGIFGVIALILTLGLSAVDAVAVLNGTVTSGSPAKAGDTDHAITIRVNVTAGRTFTLAAPDGWPQMRAQNAATLAQSYVDVDVTGVTYASPGSNEIRIPTTGTGTVAVTISYLRVKVPNAVGRDFFTIATTTPAETDDILIEVTADGSGSITLDQEGPYVPRNVLDVGVLSDAPDTFDVGPHSS